VGGIAEQDHPPGMPTVKVHQLDQPGMQPVRV
jgi:hypothetical protein